MKVLLLNKMERKDNSNLLFQELKENPFRQLNLAFFLISIIPLLAVIYLVCSDKFICIESMSDMVRISILIGVIILLGYVVGYKVMQNIIYKALNYADKAKKADESKSTFAMCLAHDLKSPLATIKTNMAGLRAGYRGELSEEQKKVVAICDDVSDRMNSMISQLIATYMIEAKRSALSISRFDLKEIIDEQRRELGAAVSIKRIAVSADVCKKPAVIEADREKITRVVNNILNNSIKYTPEGGRICIKVYAKEGFARIEFLNNGAPIPEDRLEKIFDKFERLNPAIEGHGLGLAISKDIVDLHNGKIWAENRPDKMNCFTILLPLVKA